MLLLNLVSGVFVTSRPISWFSFFKRRNLQVVIQTNALDDIWLPNKSGQTFTKKHSPKESTSLRVLRAWLILITKRPVTLQVDASQGGLGGVLLQPNDSGDLHPVPYTSCKLRPNEELWDQIEKECLAIVSACDKWYL